MNQNYFQKDVDHPYHLSVGAVVLNDKKEVCCHYFDRFFDAATNREYTDFYILMRETLEPHETLEEALARGLLEEFRMKINLRTYIGSLKSTFEHESVVIEKTTLYFLCDFVSFEKESRDAEDPESVSKIIWMPIDTLRSKMKKQGVLFQRSDADESIILERIKIFE